jgi:hypothetical protein
MFVVIQAQSGDMLFEPKHIYLRQDRIHFPKDPLNDKVAPTGTICCDEITIGKYATAERAREVIEDFFDFLNYKEDCWRWDTNEIRQINTQKNLLTYKMPKE